MSAAEPTPPSTLGAPGTERRLWRAPGKPIAEEAAMYPKGSLTPVRRDVDGGGKWTGRLELFPDASVGVVAFVSSLAVLLTDDPAPDSEFPEDPCVEEVVDSPDRWRAVSGMRS